jgi:Flp pilus assembly protein TadD
LGWLAGGLLGLATLALFWPATRCDFTNFDDPVYVTSNLNVQQGITFHSIRSAFTDIVSANWHPVTMLSHALDCQLFGLNPWGHHLTSIVLHSINTILVFILFRQIGGGVWRSLLAAALWGWHPLRVESVAWIAERKDVLSGLFGLLSLICYLRYAGQSNDPKSEVKNRKSEIRISYGLALLFFAFSLMSKPMLVTGPFLMLLLDYWPLNRFAVSDFGFRNLRVLVVEKVPFFVLSLAICIVTFLTQKYGGAMTTVESIPWNLRGENALISYFRYLGKIFWPVDYSVLYLPPDSWPLPVVLLAGAGMVGISVLFWAMRRSKPFLLIGWCWYCVTLIPVIGLVQVGIQAMANRYTYWPFLGVLLAAFWGGSEIVCRRPGFRFLVNAAAVACLILSCFSTQLQFQYWQNGEALFRQALKVTEQRECRPENSAAGQRNRAQAHYNLGNALDSRGNLTEAINEFREALRSKPDDAETHFVLGAELVKSGQSDEAIEQLKAAIRLKPGYADALNELGNAMDQKGDTEAAIQNCEAAIRLKPDLAEAHSNLGALYGKKGRLDEAIIQLQAAARLRNDDPLTFYNLGMALNEKGRTNEAIHQLEQALRLKPDFEAARESLKQLRTQ